MSLLKTFQMYSGIILLLVVLVLRLVSAQNNDLELSTTIDLESIDEIQNLLRNVQLIFETKIASKVRGRETLSADAEEAEGGAADPNGCNCSGLSCSCCTYINVPRIWLRGNACLSISYLPRNIGILLTLTFGSHRLFSKEVSARNPPPICAGIPYLRRGASICLQLYNLNVGRNAFNGCSRLNVNLFYINIFTTNVGCFQINFLDVARQQVDEVELPYLGVPEVLPVGPDPIYVGEVGLRKIMPADNKMK